MAAVMLAGCASPREQGEIPEFRDGVLAHVANLQDGWSDWLSLFRASDAVEGVLRIEDPEEIRGKPEEYLDAHIEAPRVLLGGPATGDRSFVVFNTTERRWGYWPVYSSQLQRTNGRRCLVFLYGPHVVNSREGKVLPITTLSDLSARRSQLESFLHLARLDPAQVAHLVARPDSRVSDVLQEAISATGELESIQSCYDKLVAMGDDVLPGILYAMMDALLRPEANPALKVAGVSIRPPGSSSNEPSVRADDFCDLLYLVAVSTIDYPGLPRYEDPEGRWRDVRLIALHLLAGEVKAEKAHAAR